MAELDEWYRSTQWTTDAQAEFRARLARSRKDSRPQYLYLKGCSLHEAGLIEAARELWREVLAYDPSHGFELDRLRALAWLAKSLAEAAPRKPREAEEAFRSMIARNPERHWTDEQYVGLAELLIERAGPGDLTEAELLLADWRNRTDSPFPVEFFRWNLAVIELSQARGDVERAKQAARDALELAAMGPVFSRHEKVEVVHADLETVDRLRDLANG